MNPPVDSPPPELAGRRILIVDDDRLNVRILTSILKADGYEIHAVHCEEAYHPGRDVLLRYFEEEGLTDVPFYRGRGCNQCRGTGYKGRVALHELVLITEEIRQLISEGKSAQEITRAAGRVGYRSLRYDGMRKALLGLTTIEEIEQNTAFEWAS